MSKIGLVVKREYTTRVRKKSFVIMTLFGPLVMLSMMIVPYWLSSNQNQSISVLVNDSSNMIDESNLNIDYMNISFAHLGTNNDSAYASMGYDAYVSIPTNPYTTPISITHNSNIHPIELELIQKEINQLLLCRSSFNFVVSTSDSQNSQLNMTKMFIALVGAVTIYFFIFLYGIQVMKGVIEEKNNRIVEVIITTVSPFQLMIGKIFGMALLALTQFGIWMIVVIGGYLIIYNQFGLEHYLNASAIETVTKAGTMSLDTAIGVHSFVTTMEELNLPVLLLSFSFFFLMGYLIYGALFAIVGAASDVDTETQQFIMPITVPLLSTMVFILQMFENPHSSLSKFLSYFPLTSPLAMTARLPYANDTSGFYIELLISMVLAIVGFIAIAFIASRIYRIGILSYGSKVGYSDLVKWFLSKD